MRFTSALTCVFDSHVCVIETNNMLNYCRGEPGAANAKTQGCLYGRCAGLLGRCRSWSDTSSGILTTVTSTSELCCPPLQRCARGASATCRDCDTSTSLLLPHLIETGGVVDWCGGRDQLLNWHKGTESGLDNSPLWQAPNAPSRFNRHV